MNNSALLQGLFVLDLSSVLAGPLAGSFFAELGATVIKVEHKSAGGDATRQWKQAQEDTGPISAYYAAANTGKQVVLLDINEKEDYHQLCTLVAKADVVLSNYQKKVAEKLKVSYADLQVFKPDLIFAQLSAYSYDDPRPGYDIVMQAETGWISMTGSDKNAMAKLPVALIDILASHQIREAVLLALIKRSTSGKGSEIHISLYQSAISALANQATNYLMNDQVPRPIGTLHPNIAPYGDIFTSKDGKSLLLAVGSDIQFEKLGKTLNLAADMMSTFMYNSDRVANRIELTKQLQRKFSIHDLSHINTILSSANVPFCIVKNLDEVFTDHLATEMVINEVIENIDTVKVSQLSFKFK